MKDFRKRGTLLLSVLLSTILLPAMAHAVTADEEPKQEKPKLRQDVFATGGFGRDMTKEEALQPLQEEGLRAYDAWRRKQEQLRAEQEEREQMEREAKEEHKALYNESVENLLPLDPHEIQDYIKKKDAVEGAIEPSPAKMRTQTRILRPVPGAAPQVIHLTAGYSSTLLFQDQTGEAWPVLAVVVGNAKAFSASQPRVEQKTEANGDKSSASNAHSNIVTLVPLTNHASSNLLLTLEGAPYPILLHLLTQSAAQEGRVNDALIVFRVDAPGPHARPAEIGPRESGPLSGELLQFIHGIVPDGAQRLRTVPELSGTKLWSYKGQIYLRTAHQAIWPAWNSSAGGEGLRVYVMPEAPSVVVLADGQRVSLKIDKEKDRHARSRP